MNEEFKFSDFRHEFEFMATPTYSSDVPYKKIAGMLIDCVEGLDIKMTKKTAKDVIDEVMDIVFNHIMYGSIEVMLTDMDNIKHIPLNILNKFKVNSSLSYASFSKVAGYITIKITRENKIFIDYCIQDKIFNIPIIENEYSKEKEIFYNQFYELNGDEVDYSKIVNQCKLSKGKKHECTVYEFLENTMEENEKVIILFLLNPSVISIEESGFIKRNKKTSCYLNNYSIIGLYNNIYKNIINEASRIALKKEG